MDASGQFRKNTRKIEDVIDSIIEGEKKDIARYEGAEESEPEENKKEVVQEIGREKPRIQEVESFINESYGEPRNFNNFSYEKLVNALKAALMSGVFEEKAKLNRKNRKKWRRLQKNCKIMFP